MLKPLAEYHQATILSALPTPIIMVMVAKQGDSHLNGRSLKFF
jgi:hypothetical protein